MAKTWKIVSIITAILLLSGLGILLWVRSHKRPHPFPSAIVVHESASTWGDVKAIRRWHMKRGWSDIGYHAVILNGRRSSPSHYDPRIDGKIELGRSEAVQGCHCSSDNMNSVALGVCLIGIPGKKGYPTLAQIDSLVDYLATRCLKYDIPTSAITQHSDHEPRKPLDASLPIAHLRCKVEDRINILRAAPQQTEAHQAKSVKE